MRLGAAALVEVLPPRLARQHRSRVADHPKSLSSLVRRRRDRRRLATVAPIVIELVALDRPAHGERAGVAEDAQAQRAVEGRILETKEELLVLEAPTHSAYRSRPT